MTPDAIAPLFRGPDGYRFRRWSVPLAPLISGTDDAGIALVDETLRWLAGAVGMDVTDLDPDYGANFAVLFVKDWVEIGADPGVAKMLPHWEALVPRLEGRNRYVAFRMAPTGGIRAAITLLRYDADLRAVPAQTLAMQVCARAALLWSETGIAARPLVGVADGAAFVHPEVLALIRAAYDPVLPDVADDPAHAYRIAARMEAAGLGRA